MLESFVSAWPLFQHAYLAGGLIGMLLALLGVLVVARDQIFIGAAVSQASVLGIALGLWAGSRLGPASWAQTDLVHSVLGGLFAVLAAWLTTGGGGRTGRATPEALTGWVFLGSVSGTILLLAHSPHGMEAVHRLRASTIIGARAADVWLFSALLLLTGAGLAVSHRAVLLLTLDPLMARAAGLRVGCWNGVLAAWLGLTVGFSIRVAGVVFAFASLVLPALIAKPLAPTAASLFLLAPLVSLGVSGGAFVLAHAYDYPPGQMAAAVLVLLLALTWLWRAWRLR